MKNLWKAALAVLTAIACFALAACGGEKEPKTEAALTVTPAAATVQLSAGTTELSATLSGTEGAVSWTSSDDATATVAAKAGDDKKATVTLKKAGTVTITASAGDGLSATSVLTIEDDMPSLTGLPSGVQTIKEGKTLKIAPVVKVKGAAEEGWSFSFVSSAPTVASVASDGTVTGESFGTATISVSASKFSTPEDAQGNSLQGAVSVSVIDDVEIVLKKDGAAVESFDVELNLVDNAEATFTAEVKEKGVLVSEPNGVWASAEDSVATVDEGSISAAGVGETAVTYTFTSASGHDYTVTLNVTVSEVVSIENIDASGMYVSASGKGSEQTLTAPNATENGEAGEGDGAWSLAAGSDAFVTLDAAQGKLTAKAAGAATVVYTYTSATDKPYTKEATVTVTEETFSVTIEGAEGNALALTVGGDGSATATLTATVIFNSGATATGGAFAVADGDEEIATVEEGTVTAHKHGTATVNFSITSDVTTETYTQAIAVTVDRTESAIEVKDAIDLGSEDAATNGVKLPQIDGLTSKDEIEEIKIGDVTMNLANVEVEAGVIAIKDYFDAETTVYGELGTVVTTETNIYNLPDTIYANGVIKTDDDWSAFLTKSDAFLGEAGDFKYGGYWALGADIGAVRMKIINAANSSVDFGTDLGWHGTFNGMGYTVNLGTQTHETATYGGGSMFDSVARDGVVKNMKVTGTDNKNNSGGGLVIGVLRGTAQDIYVDMNFNLDYNGGQVHTGFVYSIRTGATIRNVVVVGHVAWINGGGLSAGSGSQDYWPEHWALLGSVHNQDANNITLENIHLFQYAGGGYNEPNIKGIVMLWKNGEHNDNYPTSWVEAEDYLLECEEDREAWHWICENVSNNKTNTTSVDAARASFAETKPDLSSFEVVSYWDCSSGSPVWVGRS